MSKTRLIAVFGVLIGVALFAAMALFGINNDPSKLPSALKGKLFPEFSAPTVHDAEKIITRDDMIGRPALVNVWATWCVECKIEHPVFNELARQGVVIHGINYKDDNAEAQRWLEDFLNPYQLNISDPKGRLGFDLGVYGAPETFFIDKHGYIVHRHTGVIDERMWQEKFAAMYQELLDE
ncbi:DsbE family thiol:disulfide interchange protein [Denitrificimonas sp. JX-1]|uniref:DsbE family thiol:disulfide interchange protein n=1 Tax=Denitrificimonas halotolerans TaxID=3098930 RepID=A0ABU5GPZ2_9GAMM|nr:DsbE family thiol:disulfide interchange protein [Denitrificimonas sp. JX-1]MDY7219069.1 DsbE family thiol:disulfide interchange protein [Denitrificimonas sp. JX-1]